MGERVVAQILLPKLTLLSMHEFRKRVIWRLNGNLSGFRICHIFMVSGVSYSLFHFLFKYYFTYFSPEAA